jgi:hypothetical protein
MKGKTNDEKPPKPKKEVKVRKFDPFSYFKEEFKQHHKSISEEDLEIVSIVLMSGK